MSRFIKKPSNSGEWESERLFRMFCSINKIDIVHSQPAICLTCGSMPARDTGGKCMVCGSNDFVKADFIIRGTFPVFANGSIHERERVSDKDYENHKVLVNRGRLPIFVTAEQLKKALGK